MSGTAQRWFERLPAVTGEVPCGGEAHRISWRRGKLVLHDHDVVAERSLVALGSKPPVCLEILDAWRKLRGSELIYEFLLRESTISPEQLANRKKAYEVLRDKGEEWFLQQRFPPRPAMAKLLTHYEQEIAEQREREDRLWAITLIEALPIELRRILALSEIVGVSRHWHDDDYRRKHARDVELALTDIVMPLFEHSAREWRRNLKPYATFVAETWLLAPGEPPTCAAWADSGGAYAVLSLPLSWFIDVWARGLALVDDCFVLAVEDGYEGSSELRVVALRWERQSRKTSKSVEAPARVLRASDGEWHLHWLER